MIAKKSKYYTPEIEEFHVGFRYETHEDPRLEDGWVKYEVEQRDWDRMYCIKEDNDADYRVKYLDRADIEELGWVRNKEDDRIEHKAYKKEGYNLYWCDRDKEIAITYDWSAGSVNVFMGQNVCFVGTIKNYNELKQIMQKNGL